MMKNKYVFVLVMLVGLLVASLGLTTIYVGSTQQPQEDEKLHIVTSFYPMYIAAMNVVGDTENVELTNLSEPQTGCLHDFQLTPADMQLLSEADAFIINGGGVESFMEDVASAYPNLVIINASEHLDLLTEDEEHEDEETHEEHDHGEEPESGEHVHDHGDVNAHAWMSVEMYRGQVQAIAQGLAELDPEHEQSYLDHAAQYDVKLAELQSEQEEIASMVSGQSVILFHEAYEYVAGDYGLNVALVMDLDEERQVSAGEVAQVLEEIDEHGVTCILAEELYGQKMAQTVQKSADIRVLYLDTLNRGDYDPDSYLTGMHHNLELMRQLAETED
ncbi:MAG: metal ABC transporter substrate-binding protein [Lachnospiraceae bacterium]|nr:metal ABC transporter substrate-binding protein [Lachnospiraceae bacterium]